MSDEDILPNPLLPSQSVVAPAEIIEPPPTPDPPEPPYVTGGPPFPQFPTDDRKHGISILDYFAAHVMSGLAARSNMSIDELKNSGAQNAYWLAALMVDVRGKLPIIPTPAPPEDIEDTSSPDMAPPLPVTVRADELNR